MTKRIKLYYSVPDHFPAFRVDVSELFGVSLPARGVDVVWFMANNGPELVPSKTVFFEQICTLPLKFPGDGLFSKVISKLIYWLTDAFMMMIAAFRNFHILQTRDKYITAILGLVLCKVTGKKFVYWCSYPFPEHVVEIAKSRKGLVGGLQVLIGKMAHFLLYGFVMRFADHSFVQSQQMLRDIAAYGVPSERMTPVPMGVPPRLLDWAATRSLVVVPGRIAYLGTMATVRRLEMLIDAFSIVHRRFPSATFLMVGDGVKPQDRASLEQQAKDLGLGSAIQFTGFVSIEEAWTLAASAAICVSPFYPSQVLNSASPTKLSEYMALGRPVVCNDHPEQTEVIKDSGAGLCVPWGKDEFADAMLWMLEHPEEAEAMGARGPAWVAAHRTYPMIAEDVFRKYQQILRMDA